MGGGKGVQKRGRTQRRHFREGRENTWKHGTNKKTRSDDDAAVEDPNPNSNPNPSWEPFSTQNPGFEEYYKGQAIVPEEEWDEFISSLRKPLPAAFRINASGQFFKDIRLQLENEFTKSLDIEVNDYEIEAIRPLPWYPDKLAWHLNFSRMQLRKNQTLERFHEFLKQENEVGTITRQEAVSMVPPLFLDVLPGHYILDMCAAPGSKTFQLLEIIHQSIKPGSLPDGLVIANDVDVQRCNLLIHQTKRMCSANLVVTNHEAQYFPSCLSAKDFPRDAQGELKKDILQFDRVLCDVPCSGDGTLRKAPDIWRKWNAGMGNGVHRLQVEIAMRGITLLKVGGRMVYSTCSMNPVENEAVVAEILRRSKESVELVDVSHELPELVRRPGLRTWKVRDRGLWLAAYEDVPISRRGVILPSMFPCDEICTSKLQCDILYENATLNNSEVKNNCHFESRDHCVTMDIDNDPKKLGNDVTLVDINKNASEIEDDHKVGVSQNDLDETKAKVSSFSLERCMRIVPYDQNSGAFFIAVLHKIASLNDDSVKAITQSNRQKHRTQRSVNSALGSDDQPVVRSSIDIPQDGQCVVEAASAPCPTDKFQSVKDEQETFEAFDNGEDGNLETNQTKENLATQGKWRGVDPVVFFRDESTINSIRSFYGISDMFPLDSHLITRNYDANHVKRIYYISESVRDILELNFKVGQKLKITSLGLKVFERQASKDNSGACTFRLSSEGLPLLLPYIGKQILSASLDDFRHLLQYRTIKFPDFVDANFRENASTLMPGCCVIVLNEKNKEIFQDDSSAIAMVCWKGKTNLSIMVSQLDARELLERLHARFGGERVSGTDENDASLGAAAEMDVSAAEIVEPEFVE